MQTERLAADDAGIERAAQLLRAGALVAFPTETVYGLGGLASDDGAVKRIFEAKGRPVDRPVIVHLAHAPMINEWAVDVPEAAHVLAAKFWPGPLTLVLERAPHVSDAVTGGRDTVGLRVPSHPLARRLLEAVGTGVAAPSANRYGHVSPTTADHVLTDLAGQIAAVLDGGSCAVGLESTIVEVLSRDGDTTTTILRHGGITTEQIVETLGHEVEDATLGADEDARAPGMVSSHYAPTAPLRIVTSRAADAAPEGVIVVRPVSMEDDRAFAAALYARLRHADEQAPSAIWVVPPESGDLLRAILDRLTRAAHR